MDMNEILALLDGRGIAYEITRHKAVFRMAELSDVPLPYPEADAKNLFIRDDKHRDFWLITVRGDKRVDLKAFRRARGTRPLTFASPEELQTIMGLTPGAVTPLGLLNDEGRRVTLIPDRDFAGGLVGCHPNDNTATLWIKTDDLIALIGEHGNTVSFESF